MNRETYIGPDVHQATISLAVRDSKGEVVMESSASLQLLMSFCQLTLAYLPYRKSPYR